MAEIWGALTVAAIGAGASLYGANKQNIANNKAIDANVKAQDTQNAAQWTNWLMSRGIAPTSPVAAGVMPTAGNYTAVNQRLPLWANVSPTRTATANQPFLIRRGGTAQPTAPVTPVAPPTRSIVLPPIGANP